MGFITVAYVQGQYLIHPIVPHMTDRAALHSNINMYCFPPDWENSQLTGLSVVLESKYGRKNKPQVRHLEKK